MSKIVSVEESWGGLPDTDPQYTGGRYFRGLYIVGEYTADELSKDMKHHEGRRFSQLVSSDFRMICDSGCDAGHETSDYVRCVKCNGIMRSVRR